MLPREELAQKKIPPFPYVELRLFSAACPVREIDANSINRPGQINRNPFDKLVILGSAKWILRLLRISHLRLGLSGDFYKANGMRRHKNLSIWEMCVHAMVAGAC